MLETASVLAEKLELKPDLAHCNLGLGRLCAKMGDMEKSDRYLAKAEETFAELNMTHWLKQARVVRSHAKAAGHAK